MKILLKLRIISINSYNIQTLWRHMGQCLLRFVQRVIQPWWKESCLQLGNSWALYLYNMGSRHIVHSSARFLLKMHKSLAFCSILSCQVLCIPTKLFLNVFLIFVKSIYISLRSSSLQEDIAKSNRAKEAVISVPTWSKNLPNYK